MLTDQHKKQNITRFMKPVRIMPFVSLAIVLFVFGCKNNGNIAPLAGETSEKAATGRLTGRATRGPMSPIERRDMPSPYEPADGVTFVILTTSGQEIQSVVTDKQGNYRVDLPPGTYRVEMPQSPLGWTKDLPTEVTVAENEETRLDVRLDTGLR